MRAAQKPKFSPTRINTYLECAVKYKYVYIDKIGRFYQKPRAGYSLGTSLHKVLADFYGDGARQSPEELKASLVKNWVSAGYESSDQESESLEAGSEMMLTYHTAESKHKENRLETVGLEKTFNYDMGRFILTGRIDRLDRLLDGSMEIVDYKSGRLDVTEDEVYNDLAMCCYQLLIARLYPDVPVKSTIYCLRTGNFASATLPESDLLIFEQRVRAICTEILDRDLTKATQDCMDICDTCDFLSICTRIWAKQAKQSENNV